MLPYCHIIYLSKISKLLAAKTKTPFPWIVTSILFLLLTGCASSGVSREAASSVDLGVQNAKNLVYGTGDSDIAQAYQNTSQTAKGAVIGGAAGALVGSGTAIGVIPGILSGAIFGASYGAYIDSTTNRRDRLENRGVAPIIIGDQVLIVIPSSRLFDENTSRIKPQAYSTLEMVARYINRYTKTLVKISAYTDDTGNANVDYALSRMQAESVSKYLLASGVNARLLFAEGYGGSRLVEPVGHWDSDNYRIEISFEKLHV